VPEASRMLINSVSDDVMPCPNTGLDAGTAQSVQK